MDAVAHLALIAVVGSCVAAVLIVLFIRSAGGTQARNFFFCLAFLFVGVYMVAHNLALHRMGLGVTFGKHASIIHIREHPVEAALTFWFNILMGGVMSVCGLIGAVAFVLPEREQNTTQTRGSDEDTPEP